MLTSRGWWFLMFVLTLLAAGTATALQGVTTLLLLGLTLLVWFAWEGTYFAVQARIGVRNLSVRRELRDETASTGDV